LQSQVYEEIERVADGMKSLEGVTGVILFGSYSRGDFDEGSDVDLLLVFKDKTKLNRGLNEVYKITAKSDLPFQAVGLTLEELMSSPLLEAVLRDGRVCYAKTDVKNLLTTRHNPYALVTYSTANMNPKERVNFAQRLEGRGKGKYRYDGLVQELSGYKVGRGVVMVPLEKLKILTKCLEEKEVDYTIRYVWM